MRVLKKIVQTVKACSFEWKPSNKHLVKSTTEMVLKERDRHGFHLGLDTSLGPYAKYTYNGKRVFTSFQCYYYDWNVCYGIYAKKIWGLNIHPGCEIKIPGKELAEIWRNQGKQSDNVVGPITTKTLDAGQMNKIESKSTESREPEGKSEKKWESEVINNACYYVFVFYLLIIALDNWKICISVWKNESFM